MSSCHRNVSCKSCVFKLLSSLQNWFGMHCPECIHSAAPKNFKLLQIATTNLDFHSLFFTWIFTTPLLIHKIVALFRPNIPTWDPHHCASQRDAKTQCQAQLIFLWYQPNQTNSYQVPPGVLLDPLPVTKRFREIHEDSWLITTSLTAGSPT